MKRRLKREILSWMKPIILIIIIIFPIIYFINPVIVSGDSMEPNLKNNNYLLINKRAYKKQIPKNGDIVVFSTNLWGIKGSSKNLVKRIIASEGDHIKILNGQVYLNDEIIEENYLYEKFTSGNIDIIIPQNKVFLMGDNRDVSLDSRDKKINLINYSQIEGKVLIRIFPFNEFEFLK